jgi:hypothetical protein
MKFSKDNLPKNAHKFTKNYQPTPEQREKALETKRRRKYREDILDAVMTARIGNHLTEDELGQMYFRFKNQYPHLEDVKKLEVKDVITKHLIRYVLVNQSREASQNALKLIKTLTPTVIDDIKESLEVAIKLAENDTLKGESSI